MTSNLTFSETGLCLVCNKDTSYGNAVNIYSGLTKRNGSIHDQISDIVGTKDITEACEVSEVICHICLKLLLGINHVESELKHLKLEFQTIFQSGVQSRKANTVKCVGYSEIKYDEPPRSEVESKDEKISIDCDVNERDFRTCILKAGEDCIYDANIVVSNIKESFHVEQSSISEKESISLEDNTQENITHSKQCDFIQVTQENEDELQKEFSHALDFVKESVKKHEINCSTSDSDQKGDNHRTVDLSNIPGNLNDLPTSPNEAEDGLEGNLSFDFENFETRLCSTDTSEDNTKKTANAGPKKPRRKSNSAGKPVKRKKVLKDGKALPDAGEAPSKSFGKVEGWNVDEERHEEYKHDENRRKSSRLGRENSYDLCNQVLDSSPETVEHRVMNGDTYKYVCDQCPNVRYRHKAKLTQHFKLRHKYHVHQCPGCDTEETSQNSLDQHIINKHPDSRFFECKYCHKAFRTYRYLHFVHIKRCHIGLPVKYFCDRCPKGFVDKSSLDNHKYTHSDVKNFSCKFCGAMFHTPYSLKVHVNIHTQEKKYTCPICGTSFLRLCNLIGHKKRAHHSREKRYVCEICGTQLHTNKDLVKHQDTCHNKGKPFPSDKCDKNFSNNKICKSHLSDHLQDEPFKCHCGKAYMNRSLLQHHCKVVHRMEPGRNVTVSNGVVDTKGDDEKNEENMVVITVKECSPPALYRVQTAPSHEIFISGEIPVSHVDSNALTKTLTTGQSVELPLLHSPFGALGTDRVSLSAPILFTSLTTNPSVAVHHAQDTISQGILPSKLDPSMSHITSGVQEDFSYHAGSTATTADAEDQDPLQVLQEETRESQAANPLATELLELPGVHAGNPNDVPVTYITAWP
ncbi:PR domain zinc finger protein 5-like [Macrobrachium nipponense]|uniref:PR domain zinc finger protein 5-like n=1 Tax=Macrobrachium nipponense TaxID=159736 RepID=UPI0030C7D5F2